MTKIISFIKQQLRHPEILLFLVGVFVFINTLHNDFLIDDNRFFGNRYFTDISFWWLHFIPDSILHSYLPQLEMDVPYYRPIAHLVPMLCYQVFLKNPVGYHVVNILLHVGASCMVFRFFKLLNISQKVSFVAALFYLVHPINSICVNYKTASIFSVLIICIFSSINLFIQDKRFSFLFFVLAMLCHEVAIVLPFILIAYCYFMRSLTWYESIKKVFPLLVFVCIYMFFRLSTKSLATNYINPIVDIGYMFNILLTYFELALWYVVKIIFPFGIVLSLTMAVATDWINMLIGGLAACLVLGLFYRIFLCRTDATVRFMFSLILIGFAICFPASTMNVYSAGVFTFEPHWMIIPSVAIFFLCSSFFLKFTKPVSGVCIALIIAVLWSTNTLILNTIWARKLNYLEYWSLQDPLNKITQGTLADAYMFEGEYRNARKMYLKSLNGNSYDWKSYVNLGLIDYKLKNYDSAKDFLFKAIERNPNIPAPYINLSHLYIMQGNEVAAKDILHKLIRINPLSAEAYINLSVMARNDQNLVLAQQYLLSALEIEPGNDRVILNLIRIYYSLSNHQGYEDLLNKSINNVEDPTVLIELGIFAMQNKLYTQSEKLFARAIKLDKTLAYLNIGNFLANSGRYEDAIKMWSIGESMSNQKSLFSDRINKARSLQ